MLKYIFLDFIQLFFIDILNFNQFSDKNMTSRFFETFQENNLNL